MKYASAHKLALELKKRGKPIASVSTVQRALHEAGYKWRPLPHRKLTSSQKAQRVLFCQAHLEDDWSGTWMFDEVYFNLYRHGNRYWVSVYTEESMEKPKLTNAQEKVSVGACFAICKGKKSALCFLPKNWNAEDLSVIFKQTLLPSIKWNKYSHIKQRFLVDNDGRHFSAKFVELEKEKRLNRISPWPANSPDFNGAENVNAWLKSKVEACFPTNEQELKAAIESAYEDFPVQFTVNIATSMHARLEYSLQHKGARTKY